MTPEVCPTCGAEVPPRAKACPECGADEKTGWSDEAYADNVGLPEDSFDYDEFVEREFKGKTPRRSFQWVWAVVAVILVVLLIAFVL